MIRGAGCGKSTLGTAPAATLDVPFAEGDDFHSDAARATMAAGVPLTDADRWPWLNRPVARMDGHQATGSVVSCSALRHAYRDRLRAAFGSVTFYELDVEPGALRRRTAQRVGHYMPVALPESQLATVATRHPGAARSRRGRPARRDTARRRPRHRHSGGPASDVLSGICHVQRASPRPHPERQRVLDAEGQPSRPRPPVRSNATSWVLADACNSGPQRERWPWIDADDGRVTFRLVRTWLSYRSTRF